MGFGVLGAEACERRDFGLFGAHSSGGGEVFKLQVLGGLRRYVVVSLNYCSQNGGNLYRARYYNGKPNIGPRIIGNLDQYPCRGFFMDINLYEVDVGP